MMAEATGKLTGTPGICFVTRGPGATNASAGIHIARQDSTPMILFVGQIAQGQTDREAFQEVDYRAMFAPLAKWVAQIEDTARIPEYVARAYRTAMSGRPGPVVLALPEDVLSAQADVADFHGSLASLPTLPNMAPVAQALAQAKRPLVVVGGPHWSDQAAQDLQAFAEAWNVPVACGFRRQGHFDNRHPNYAGDLSVGINPKLAARLREADCLLLLGTRFGDIETQGYTLVDPANPAKTILHIHASADELGQVYGPDIAITATAPDAIAALKAEPPAGAWPEWTAAARADYDNWLKPAETPGPVKLEQVVQTVRAATADTAITCNGAGNYAAWLHRYFTWVQPGTQLAPTSGSMGYGFPASVAASLHHPDRDVICFAGDGCFQMTCNEMSTAIQHRAKPIVIVVNNGRYGTIRMHQEKTYPGRTSGTDLANPDFAALARAYGGFGAVVERTEDFAAAFQAARDAGTLAVIELRVGGEAISPSLSLASMQKA